MELLNKVMLPTVSCQLNINALKYQTELSVKWNLWIVIYNAYILFAKDILLLVRILIYTLSLLREKLTLELIIS